MNMSNWTYWQEHLMELIMEPYETAVGLFVWPLLFIAVIGYVYFKQQSYVAAAVAGMTIFAVFGNYLIGMETFVNLMYVLVALAITMLFLIFLTKRRG